MASPKVDSIDMSRRGDFTMTLKSELTFDALKKLSRAIAGIRPDDPLQVELEATREDLDMAMKAFDEFSPNDSNEVFKVKPVTIPPGVDGELS